MARLRSSRPVSIPLVDDEETRGPREGQANIAHRPDGGRVRWHCKGDGAPVEDPREPETSSSSSKSAAV